MAPATTLRPASVRRTRSGETNERRKLTERDDADQQQHDLGQVEEEERERGTEALARVEAQDVGREPVDGRREQDPGDEPGGDAGPDARARTAAWTRRSASVVIRGLAASASACPRDAGLVALVVAASVRRPRGDWRGRDRRRAAGRGGC